MTTTARTDPDGASLRWARPSWSRRVTWRSRPSPPASAVRLARREGRSSGRTDLRVRSSHRRRVAPGLLFRLRSGNIPLAGQRHAARYAHGPRGTPAAMGRRPNALSGSCPGPPQRRPRRPRRPRPLLTERGPRIPLGEVHLHSTLGDRWRTHTSVGCVLRHPVAGDLHALVGARLVLAHRDGGPSVRGAEKRVADEPCDPAKQPLDLVARLGDAIEEVAGSRA